MRVKWTKVDMGRRSLHPFESSQWGSRGPRGRAALNRSHMRLFCALSRPFGLFGRSCEKKKRFCFAFGARLGRPSPISRRLGRSRDRFGRPKRLYFGSSRLRSRVRCVLRPMATKHCKKWYRTHIGAVARHAKNDQNSCSERSCQGSTLRTRSVAASARHRSVPGSV